MEPEIIFHNKYSSKLETEKVYGEKWLIFIYENFIGRLCLWTLVRRKFFSKWYGWKMDRKKSRSKIVPFIEKFDLDTREFADDVSTFRTFNEFFFRRLKSSSRPLSKESNTAIFPADGRHLAFDDLQNVKGVFVKGQKFNLTKLFGSKELATPYQKGSLILSRLCPTDYHRFHFPVSGKMEKVNLINGELYSVNPIALRKNLSIFWENKRYLTFIHSKEFGRVAIFLVGATCVGSVHLTAKENHFYKKGEELGYFSFGGSSLITLFSENMIKLNHDLTVTSSNGYETYVKMGEAIGKSSFS
mgnify:CR=1 FL=1